MPSPVVRLLQSLLLAALLGVSALASAARIGGVGFDERVRLADAELLLNGVGLRAVLTFKGYAAGLYLPERATTPAQVLATPGPKRVQMKMMVDVPTKEFVKAFDVGMKRNHTEAEHQALQERMLQFDRNVTLIGAVKKGDVIDLDFLPPRGLVLRINGQPRGEPIPGEDLYAGLLKIFIGERPVDKKLKAGLLGAAPN